MQAEGDEEAERIYGMGIDINKCIGCGRCAQACKNENDVPDEPYFFNTWVERYLIRD
ncbi:MAG: 4Fe-4S binding protein, partial [Gemmatimonadetes bacterium]|nr:4Fe-4S binding protein [Gemmatimonadota bacterium]